MWKVLKNAGIAGRGCFKQDEISCEPELKVEVTISAEKLKETVAAVKAVHPYEEPVINAIPLIGIGL